MRTQSQVELSSLLTASQVARRRGRHVRTIQRDTAKGKLRPIIVIGVTALYRPDDVETYLAECRSCDTK